MTEESLLHLSNRILENSFSNEDVKLIQTLFFSDSEEIGDFDLIVVLAGEKLNRMESAVKLYQMRKVPILISGGNLSKEGIREWEKYFHYGESHGVLTGDMLVEGESKNTYENLLYSLKILSKKDEFQRPVFVSSSQHLLRVSLTLFKVLEEFPLSITYSFYPADSKNVTSESWYFSSEGRSEIAGELNKILQYHLISYLKFK